MLHLRKGLEATFRKTLKDLEGTYRRKVERKEPIGLLVSGVTNLLIGAIAVQLFPCGVTIGGISRLYFVSRCNSREMPNDLEFVKGGFRCHSVTADGNSALHSRDHCHKAFSFLCSQRRKGLAFSYQKPIACFLTITLQHEIGGIVTTKQAMQQIHDSKEYR